MMRDPTLADVLRAGLPAMGLSLLLAYGLRFTTLTPGPRVAASFFLFAALYTLAHTRLVGTKRSALQWVTTVAGWVLVALAMWFIAEL